MTPLMFAIRSGDLATTNALLDLGANLSATAADGTTSLVLAILNAHWELAAALIERGADPNGQDPRGRPLHVLAFARRADNRGLSIVLPRRPTGRIDSIDLAKLLVARGANVNDRIDWKNPSYAPSHLAISQVQPTSFVGATPLYIAAKNCDVEMVRFLAANGAEANVATSQNITPLLVAAGVGYLSGEAPGGPEEAFETVKVLFSLGNDVNAVADFGGGADARGGAWKGAGALHGAVIRGAEALAAWLIERGVPLDRRTATGKTALDLARGSTLGINYKVWPEIARLIEAAMRAQGLPVPEHSYNQNADNLGVN
jgi:ankyrin repeat protein